VYLLRPDTGRLAFAAAASTANLPSDHWLSTVRLEVGTGMFGLAVAERRVQVTEDYPVDTRFEHTPETDAFARETGLRSFAVAPLVAGSVVFGALGVYDRDAAAFTDQHVALVRALADHAALAMANARLIGGAGSNPPRHLPPGGRRTLAP
jgi:GAF domain-containing protein